MYQNWLEKVNEKLDKALVKHDKKTIEKFNAKSFRRVATRVFERSNADCDECNEYRKKIEECIQIISSYDTNDKKAYGKYNKIMREIVSHLKRRHHYVQEGTYLATYLPLGVAMGLVINSFNEETFSLGFGLVIGIGLGIAIGSLLDYNAKKNDNVM